MLGPCGGIWKLSRGELGGHSMSLWRRNIRGHDGMWPWSVNYTEATQKKEDRNLHLDQ